MLTLAATRTPMLGHLGAWLLLPGGMVGSSPCWEPRGPSGQQPGARLRAGGSWRGWAPSQPWGQLLAHGSLLSMSKDASCGKARAETVTSLSFLICMIPSGPQTFNTFILR